MGNKQQAADGLFGVLVVFTIATACAVDTDGKPLSITARTPTGKDMETITFHFGACPEGDTDHCTQWNDRTASVTWTDRIIWHDDHVKGVIRFNAEYYTPKRMLTLCDQDALRLLDVTYDGVEYPHAPFIVEQDGRNCRVYLSIDDLY